MTHLNQKVRTLVAEIAEFAGQFQAFESLHRYQGIERWLDKANMPGVANVFRQERVTRMDYQPPQETHCLTEAMNLTQNVEDFDQGKDRRSAIILRQFAENTQIRLDVYEQFKDQLKDFQYAAPEPLFETGWVALAKLRSHYLATKTK